MTTCCAEDESSPLWSSSRALKDAGFSIQERGQIEVKGKGLMTTYFLMGNLLLSEDGIMGREVGGASLYREDLCGQSSSGKKHKVHSQIMNKIKATSTEMW